MALSTTSRRIGMIKAISTRLCPESERLFPVLCMRMVATSNDSNPHTGLTNAVPAFRRVLLHLLIKVEFGGDILDVELIQQPVQVATADAQFPCRFQFVSGVHTQRRAHQFALKTADASMERAVDNRVGNCHCFQL